MTCRLHVVMACEDSAATRQAEQLCGSLAIQLEGGFEFEVQAWTFDELADLHLRTIAARHAAMADIIVVACQGAHALPGSVNAWLELWVGRNANPCALVMFSDPKGSATPPREETRRLLQQAAERGRMDFFASSGIAARLDAPAEQVTQVPLAEPARPWAPASCA